MFGKYILNLNAKINTLDNVANDKNIRDIITYKDLVIAIFIPFEFWIISIEKTTNINEQLNDFTCVLFEKIITFSPNLTYYN